MTSPWLVLGIIEHSRTTKPTKEKKTMESWQTIAGLAARHVLTGWGTYLASKAMIGSDPAALETFVGAGMVFFGIGWSVFEKWGTVKVGATTAKARGLLMLAIMVTGLLALSQETGAADMPPPVLKARAQAAPVTVVSWASGLYFGANVSGTKSAGDFTMAASSGVGEARASGLMAGGTIGLGAWLGGLYVGAEVDGDYDFGKANVACGFAAVECKMRDGYLLTQRLLVGLTMPGAMSAQRAVSAPAQWPTALDVPASVTAAVIMPYLTGGVAQRRTQACIEAIGCAKDWLVGWTAGGGLKIPVSQAVSLDIGYLYVGWNKHLNPAADAAVVFPAVDFKATSEHVLKAGLQFHL